MYRGNKAILFFPFLSSSNMISEEKLALEGFRTFLVHGDTMSKTENAIRMEQKSPNEKTTNLFCYAHELNYSSLGVQKIEHRIGQTIDHSSFLRRWAVCISFSNRNVHIAFRFRPGMNQCLLDDNFLFQHESTTSELRKKIVNRLLCERGAVHFYVPLRDSLVLYRAPSQRSLRRRQIRDSGRRCISADYGG